MENHIIINVGRQFGSGGKSVAVCLGEKLGIKVYDNELLSAAAEQSGFSPELFSRSDEKKHNFSLGSLFSSNRFEGAFTQSGISESSLFKIQSEVIRDIASKGDAIFIGRASDYVLRDMDCLDVFICAPVEDRKKRVAERMGITPEEAGRLIEKNDKARAEYYNFFTFGHWGKASNYDLCIDSSILGIEGTSDFIIDFLKRK